MINLEKLINKGIYILTPSQDVEEKTVIVLGIARSGTTVVAKILQSLGIYMGDKVSAVMEDIELFTCLEQNNIEKAKEIIQNRNLQYKIWGWKRPEAFLYYNLWKELFRNPHIIIIFRDPLAVSLRNFLSVNLEVRKGLKLIP